MNLVTSIVLIVSAFLLGLAAGGVIASLLPEKKPTDRVDGSPLEGGISLRKHPTSGHFEVRLASQTFGSPEEMNPVQRSLAANLASSLNAWLSSQPDQPQPASPTTDESAPMANAPDQIPEPVVKPLPIAETKPLDGDIGLPQEEEAPRKPVRESFATAMTRALRAEFSTEPASIQSIAVQVNEILQKKIKGTPLDERGISLMELPDQGMVVMIGLDKYDSVNAVPDDEIRGVLQGAVNEWLAKNIQIK